jgi:predicted CxxxxCH...CXXCH cytochrome family protein
MDGSVQVTGYTGDDPALAAAVKDPGWETTGASCSASYCHGASPALGGGAVPFPVWTKVDGSQVFCGSCHGLPPRGHPALAPGSTVATCAACHPGTVTPDGTIDVAGGLHMNGRQDGFAGHPDGWAEGVVHGLAAAQDLTSCFACHTPKKPARISALSCATCHDPMAGGDWTTTCRNCHGSSTSAAPPRDTHGNMATTARGVGAHQSHMKGTHGVAGPLDCVHCHRKPADIFGPGHMNGKVELSGYTGSDPAMAAALSSQGWDEAALTCTNYCHGATLGGGTAMQPVWTRVDGAQAACGSCHGLPPARHMALTPPVTAATCSTCHPATVRPDGTIDVAGGKHVNGTVEIAGFTGHGAGWLVPTDQGFHGQAVVAQGLYGCAACHSPKEPTTNGIRSCATCHDTLAGGADWTTSCAGCHGSSASVAPPKDLHGNTATTFVGVGAHQSHLAGTHGVAAPLDCDSCHPIPSTVLQRPHADGTVDVTGYTGSDPALLAAVTAPGWGTASNSCGTSYCHGATLGGGTAMKPVWTRVDGTQAACGSCHGLPPTHHMTLTAPGTAATCSTCHPATVRPDGSIDVAGGKHLNGRIETDGFAGHGAGWIVPGDPAFHGQAATTQGMNTCFACHSPKEPATNGVPSCASCHDALAGGVDWTTACVGCHGSGGTSAPPKDTHGNTTTTALGVGAHRSHVEATHGLARRFDCDACHQKPAVVFSPGHLDGTTRVTGYTGSDPGLQSVTDPSWNRASATCATSWCHGNYSGTFSFRNTEGDDVTIGYSGTPASPSWTRVDGTQGACGTCHALPPQNGQWHNPFHARGFSPNGSACSLCHPGVKADGSGFVDVALHVDGRVDVTPAWGLDCVACH